MSVYTVSKKLGRGLYRLLSEPFFKNAFSKCGTNVRVPKGCEFSGIENISIGNNVALGSELKILNTKAKLVVGNDVMFGPNVAIVTGDYRIDIPGRTMISLTDKHKLPENDQDVVFERDNWIGTNATILKGVTVGYGAVVAAGAVVADDVLPYTCVEACQQGL